MYQLKIIDLKSIIWVNLKVHGWYVRFFKHYTLSNKYSRLSQWLLATILYNKILFVGWINLLYLNLILKLNMVGRTRSCTEVKLEHPGKLRWLLIIRPETAAYLMNSRQNTTLRILTCREQLVPWVDFTFLFFQLYYSTIIFSLYLHYFKKIFLIYLAAQGLSWGMEDLWFSLWHAGFFLVSAPELLVATYVI